MLKVSNGTHMIGNVRGAVDRAAPHVSYPRVYVAASAFNFMYRSPIPIVSYLNLAKAFSTDIWALLPSSVLVFAFLFGLIYQ